CAPGWPRPRDSAERAAARNLLYCEWSLWLPGRLSGSQRPLQAPLGKGPVCPGVDTSRPAQRATPRRAAHAVCFPTLEEIRGHIPGAGEWWRTGEWYRRTPRTGALCLLADSSADVLALRVS